MFFPTTFYMLLVEYMLFLTTLYILLVKYMYSLVVPVKVASPVAIVQVGYILRCRLLCYLHEPRACGPLSCK